MVTYYELLNEAIKHVDDATLQEAIDNEKYNHERALKYPETEKQFQVEKEWDVDPNNFEEMKRLYSAYGYQYSQSLWRVQQETFNAAHRAADKRNKLARQNKE